MAQEIYQHLCPHIYFKKTSKMTSEQILHHASLRAL